MSAKSYGFNTRSVHAGQVPDPATGSRAVPLYQTTSYVFDDTQSGADLFSLNRPGHIYTRISNPTTSVFEERIASLEGGVGALATASGAAAITCAVMNLAQAGDHIVSATTLYGGTFNLFANNLPHYGITTTFVNTDDPAAFTAACRDSTKAFYIESIGNPLSNVADIAAIADAAHACGVPLIIDNTFGTPWLVRPIEYGADIVIHSATKFIGGHGTSVGGVIVDAGKFDYAASGRFPMLSQPDPGYHGLCYTREFGAAAFITRARTSLMRDMGAALSPFNAWLFIQGLETLPLRVARHSETAAKVAAWLQKHPNVAWVRYPGLPGDPSHELAKRYLPRGCGSIFAFGIKGGRAAAARFIDHLELFSLLANVADAKSLVIHPASTTHSQMSDDELAQCGITPELIRLSIGLEDCEDLTADLDQALAQS
ncbi:MAG TPA: bifunctional O-acetylhomoserine aminocarboxypropyltransferase/cysteine synthase [Clostridiales bacterium]|nr:bifunctional O-acetylhomoserine aminocarboxypropyltransferase/cysteine synthase [Clostridiales bacterium]